MGLLKTDIIDRIGNLPCSMSFENLVTTSDTVVHRLWRAAKKHKALGLQYVCEDVFISRGLRNFL